jgi:hypothetical protein
MCKRVPGGIVLVRSALAATPEVSRLPTFRTRHTDRLTETL